MPKCFQSLDYCLDKGKNQIEKEENVVFPLRRSLHEAVERSMKCGFLEELQSVLNYPHVVYEKDSPWLFKNILLPRQEYTMEKRQPLQ